MILIGDCREQLKTLSDCSVQCCVTSPPYWGLRDYGCDGQLGLESTPDEYVANMVAVFREVRRVLRDDGTLWLNLGDSYSGSGKGGNPEEGKQATNKGSQSIGVLYGKTGETAREAALTNVSRRWTVEQGIAPKNLIGIPWRVAFALQSDGWYLRQDIIWAKPNPMPESVRDRCTKAHEYIFLLSKNERYYFDADAIAEPSADPVGSAKRYESDFGGAKAEALKATKYGNTKVCGPREFDGTRNKRSVWTVPTSPYSGAHFATFPPALIEPCILAGCPVGGVVLDPFFGSGTVGQVCESLGRNWIGIELNAEYVKLAENRTQQMGLKI